jgi:hypothetical protein
MPGFQYQRERNPLIDMLLVVYIGSFFLPAIKTRDGEELLGIQVFGDGFQRAWTRTKPPAFEEDRRTADLEMAGGFANPLMWLALYGVFTQRWLLAGTLSGVAFALGAGSVCLLFKAAIGQRLQLGCYLWLSSMLAAALVANVQWRFRLIGRGG